MQNGICDTCLELESALERELGLATERDRRGELTIDLRRGRSWTLVRRRQAVTAHAQLYDS